MIVDFNNLTFSIEHLDPMINYEWSHPHYYEDINDSYIIDYARELGRGHNTIIRKCVERRTGKRYAVKSVEKVCPRQVSAVKEEAMILSKLDHPTILKVFESFEDEKYFHLVTELCKGGELYTKVEKLTLKGKKYPEKKAIKIVQQLLEAIIYCHEQDVVHRDIKLENVLFTSKKRGTTEIKLIDFGLATIYNKAKDEPMTRRVGTPLYVPPEVLNGHYSNSCDMWSLGVLTYGLLTGKAPFEDYNEIRSNEPVNFNSKDWDGISYEAKHFIKSLLQKDPTLRPSAAEAVHHEWISGETIQKISKLRHTESLFERFTRPIQILSRSRIHPHL